MFANQTILVTGGSGSFGTAFSKYLLDKNVGKVIIFSRCWLKQKTLRDELGDPPNYRWFIGDVRDRDRLIRACKGVDIVLHAAAIKCIDACNYNPGEALNTNVTGTQNTIDACIECGVGKSILISTDKCVNAINTYGKTKALAESLWINANTTAATDNIRFSVCRYGNVVGSSGSILPVWKKLIADGAKELPVTHSDMTRYWLSMENAIKLVVDSIAQMQGGEIFKPTMPSVRIIDVAAAFKLPYKVVGIREGEKLSEEIEPGRDSSNNEWFLTVDEIRETIGAI